MPDHAVKNVDTTILELFAQGHHDRAFRVLVETYSQRMYAHIRRMVLHHDDANDVLQNTFVKVYRYMGQFKGEAKLYTWLYRIASNEAITFINARTARHHVSVEDQAASLSARLQADDYFDGDELQERLKVAIALLPTKQQLVFNMRYYDEMSYEDMAEALETSAGALRASFHLAVKKVARFLEQHTS
jgi:RNA polymerase sigma factor (sigma-70 family)